MKGEYLFIEILVMCSLLILYKIFKLDFFKKKKELLKTIAVLFVIYFTWETFALIRGHWGFGEQFIIGYIWLFPIEEILFIIFIATFLPIIFWEISKRVLRK